MGWKKKKKKKKKLIESRVFVPRVPAYPSLFNSEPSRLGQTLIYTRYILQRLYPYTFASRPCRLQTENGEYPYLRSHNTLRTHTRYPDQRKRPYYTMNQEIDTTITRSPNLPKLLFAERPMPIAALRSNTMVSPRGWYWMFDDIDWTDIGLDCYISGCPQRGPFWVLMVMCEGIPIISFYYGGP